jgi:hypothetical protein
VVHSGKDKAKSSVPPLQLETTAPFKLSAHARKHPKVHNDFIRGMPAQNSLSKPDSTSPQSSKHKSQALDVTARLTESQSLEMSAPPEIQETPEGITLMGVYMRIHKERNEGEKGEITSMIKSSSNGNSGFLSGSSRSSSSMVKQINHNNIIPHLNLDSPSSLTIHISSPVKYSLQGLAEAQSLVSDQQGNKEEQIFKFDKAVFTDCKASKINEPTQRKIFTLMKELHLDQELVFSEDTFIPYRSYFHLPEINQKQVIWASTSQDNISMYDSLKESFEFLTNNKDIWCKYWLREMNNEFKNDEFNHQGFRYLLQGSVWEDQQNKLILLKFLITKRIIDTIVPRTKNNSSSELEEAFEVWKLHFTQVGKVGTTSRRLKKAKTLTRYYVENFYSVSWKLLRLWMQTYRKVWLDKIEKHDGNPSIANTKKFFNVIFCHSIEKLTERAKQAIS